MIPLYSKEDMDEIVLAEARKPGDTTMQAYVDFWLNERLAYYAELYDFPELMTDWHTTLTTTAPTPHTWAPYELNAVPRDILKLMNAHMTDPTNTSDQPVLPLEVIPMFEFGRRVKVVNPPVSSTPKRVCLRRVEGIREEGFDPTTGATGIRLWSSASEAATLLVGFHYYDTANRWGSQSAGGIAKAQTSAQITTAHATLVSGTHYGIKSIGKNDASTGIITVTNTAETIHFATLLPWEKSASYIVLAFDYLPDKAYPLHLKYKRRPEYLSNASDNCSPLPGLVQVAILAYAKMKALKFNEDADWVGYQQELQMAERELAYTYHADVLEEAHVVLG